MEEQHPALRPTNVSKQIIVGQSYNKRFEVLDVFILIFTGLLGFVLSILVAPIFKWIFIIGMVAIMGLLLQKSEVYDKKVYQIMIKIILKPRGVYHAATREDLQEKVRKDLEHET